MSPAVTTPRLDPGVALLHTHGVVLVVVAPGEVVLSPFARNVERAAALLKQMRARLVIAHGTEYYDVTPTAALLRERRRTTWAIGEARVDIDFEPLPDLTYGRLALDALPTEPGDHGPPWAGDWHRERIASARADTPGRSPAARR
ncbi:hypothetical protein NBH00_25105 [Paraconexibacter antarcticus]|uniref:Uncharacterized protein n=1 Tax=Paraconexibacter antarcticus TaxID=2949664 RepID=A0ABY5DRD9_9ACTN|nr:hypothetical protein [Paraconexibacter antarcticus]UTI64598.1 hypothetical protein NBH00_25105 [Paraconexibacter antarcticus]